jgi:NADH-quinone oxidoreductase subunit J
MKMIGKYSIASALRWLLGFLNVFVMIGAEFLAMILIVVYVGAVAVLFLFIVMMLDIDFTQLREGFQRYAPIGAVVGGILFLELLLVLGAWHFSDIAGSLRFSPMPENGLTNTEALGRIIYTDYVYAFQLAGLILLVAMIGAIVLTHRERPGTKRQNVAVQVARTGSISLEQVPTGAGVAALGIRRPPEPEPEPVKVAHEDAHGHGGHH